jgi:hypothetical protein
MTHSTLLWNAPDLFPRIAVVLFIFKDSTIIPLQDSAVIPLMMVESTPVIRIRAAARGGLVAAGLRVWGCKSLMQTRFCPAKVGLLAHNGPTSERRGPHVFRMRGSFIRKRLSVPRAAASASGCRTWGFKARIRNPRAESRPPTDLTDLTRRGNQP